MCSYYHNCILPVRMNSQVTTLTQQCHLFSIFLYSNFQPLLHMNQKATFIFSLYEAKVISKSKPTRSAGWILLSVCVCTLQIYTTYTYSIFISCRNFTKSQNLLKKHTVEFFSNRTTQYIFLSRHARRRAWV